VTVWHIWCPGHVNRTYCGRAATDDLAVIPASLPELDTIATLGFVSLGPYGVCHMCATSVVAARRRASP
jgi:hypothetical protein